MELILAESHLYHKLMFPGMLMRKPSPEHSAIARGDEELSLALDLMGGMEQALAPYEEQISRFFHPEFSLPEALMGAFPLEKRDTSGWCEAIAAAGPERIRKELLRAVLPERELTQVFTEEEIPELLNRSILPQGACWMLWGILRDPLAAIRDLNTLYESLRLFSDALTDPLDMEAWQALEKLESYFRGFEREWEKMGADLRLVRSVRETRAAKWQVMPSLVPWEFRVGYERELLIVGYKIPCFLDALRRAAEEEQEARSMFCQSLADPTRYRLCCLLARQPMLQKDLAEQLGVSQATVSHHLQHLRKAGILSETRGKQLASEPIRRFLQGMASDLRVG